MSKWKDKTRGGFDCVIHTEGGNNPDRPIVGEIKGLEGDWSVTRWMRDGKYFSIRETDYDLIPATPYDHIKPGDLVMVWEISPRNARLRRFYGALDNGRVQAYFQVGSLMHHC